MNKNTMAAEIAALEKASYQAVPSEEQEIEVTESTETPPEEVAEVITEEPEVIKEPDDAPQAIDYKKRFTNFKASSDATIHGLRLQAVSFQEDMQKMQKIIQNLTEQVNKTTASKDPYEGLFTAEEKDLIGEETLAAIAKANKAALDSTVGPLRTQLDEEKKAAQARRAKELEREKQNLSQDFFVKLEGMVPNFRKTDTNLGFLNWMKEADRASGYPREVIFKRAQASGDVGRCADFMLEYRRLTTPKDKLAGKVTPTSSATGRRPVQPKPTTPQVTPAFIDKFYADATRGKYKGKEKERQAIEKSIDDHIRGLSGGS